MKRILFIADTPGGVKRALARKVAHLAKRLGAEVEVFDCAYDSRLTDPGRIREAVERRRQELTQIARVLEASDVPARATVLWAHPVRDGIAQQIRRYRPDLLILVSGSRSRDHKLIEQAQCAILVIRNDRPHEGLARVIAAVDPMHAHDKPAALDERIVEMGSTLAKSLQLPLHVYHARPLLPQGLPRDVRVRDLPEAVYADICGAWHARAESRVRQLAESAQVPESRTHVPVGEPVDLLCGFVGKKSSDLLVMGAVARSRLKKVLIGHTAEKVLDRTDCDVLVVKLRPAAARVANVARR